MRENSDWKGTTWRPRMPGSDKKSRSRETFAAVFEEQTRRFSAFELLGLSSNTEAPTVLPISPTPDTPELVPREVESRSPGQALALGTDGQAQGLRLDSLGIAQGLDHPIVHSRRRLKKIPVLDRDSQTPIL